MKPCAFCGVPVKRSGNKFCCREHERIFSAMRAAGITDYKEYLRRLEGKIRCQCCGEEYPVAAFRKNNRNKWSLDVNATCEYCRKSGKSLQWSAQIGGQKTQDRHIIVNGLTVDKYGQTRKMTMMSGNLDALCFDPRMIWEPSPSGVAG